MRLLTLALSFLLSLSRASGQTYTISTIAGGGGLPPNTLGTSVAIGTLDLAVDPSGNLFFVVGNTVLRFDAATGILAVFAGNGTTGFSGDNGPATSAQLWNPLGLAVDSTGDLYIADYTNGRVRKVSNGLITTVAGNGVHGFSGDNGPATSAQLGGPVYVA